MYGTVAKLKLKPGSLEAVKQVTDEIERGPRTVTIGHIATYLYLADNEPDTVYLVVIFESREAYHKNAQSEEQNAEYERLAVHFAAPPEWHDGEVIWAFDRRL